MVRPPSTTRTGTDAVDLPPAVVDARRDNRENTSTMTSVARNSHNSVTPRSDGSTFCCRITSTMPTPMPATSTIGSERMRASNATTSARSSNW